MVFTLMGFSLPSTNQEQDYNLDALGNWSTTTITPEGGSPATQTRIHNKLNEVTKYGTTNVLYDHGNNTIPHANRGNGNIADDGDRTYAYDAFNRLTTVARKSDGAIVGQYTYDALGRRIRKIVSNGGLRVGLAWSTLDAAQWSLLSVGDWASLPLDPGTIANVTTRYLYDQNQCVEELNVIAGTTLRQFIWGQYIDELIQMKTYADTGSQPLAAGVYYPLSDLLYRSQALTDSIGEIQEAYDCDAYGNTLIFSGPGADTLWFTDDDVQTLQPACEYIFTGRQYDPESQFYYYRARCYQPPLGRFISRDPILYTAGINLYEYTGGNPALLTDPNGRQSAESTSKCNPLKIAFLGADPDHSNAAWYAGDGDINEGADKTFDSLSEQEAFDYVTKHFKGIKPPFDLRITGYSWGGWTALILAHDLGSDYKIRMALVDPVKAFRTERHRRLASVPGHKHPESVPYGPAFGTKPANVVAGAEWYQTAGLGGLLNILLIGKLFVGVPIEGMNPQDVTNMVKDQPSPHVAICGGPPYPTYCKQAVDFVVV